VTGEAERLLELLGHADMSVRAQGIELLRAVPDELKRAVFLRAVDAGDWQTTARITGDHVPVMVGWHTRRIWVRAAQRLREAHAVHGLPFSAAYASALDAMEASLWQPPTATRRVAVGAARNAFVEERRAHPPPRGTWEAPAEHILRALHEHGTNAYDAQAQSHTRLAAWFSQRSHRKLYPWQDPAALLELVAGMAIMRLPRLPLVSEATRKQALLFTDGASMTTQRALCERLSREQRAVADQLMQSARDDVQRWWHSTLRDLGAAPDSALFAP